MLLSLENVVALIEYPRDHVSTPSHNFPLLSRSEPIEYDASISSVHDLPAWSNPLARFRRPEVAGPKGETTVSIERTESSPFGIQGCESKRFAHLVESRRSSPV